MVLSSYILVFIGHDEFYLSRYQADAQPVNPAIPIQLGGFYDDSHHQSTRANIL
jgi:hypothetical protein